MNSQIYKASQPVYDIAKSWDYNYQKGPFFKGPYPPIPKKAEWEFLGHKLISPLGIAAGPLPNAKWLITYAKLGYGSLIQKTVRSSAHKSHPSPNIVYVESNRKKIAKSDTLVGFKKYNGSLEKLSITNSLGNPCKSPKEWMQEAKKTKQVIKKGQLFGISVYGTQKEKTTLEELAKDYAKVAKMAKEAGAQFIEANLACPNVKGSENPFLYRDPESVMGISRAIKFTIGNLPLVLKIGYFESFKNLLDVLKAAKGHFEAISAINTIPKKVLDKNGKQILPGRDTSGICGFVIKDYGIKMVEDLIKAKKLAKYNFEVIGVGGVMRPQDVSNYLNAGANHVHSATAVMWNPYLAYETNQYLKNHHGS